MLSSHLFPSSYVPNRLQPEVRKLPVRHTTPYSSTGRLQFCDISQPQTASSERASQSVRHPLSPGQIVANP